MQTLRKKTSPCKYKNEPSRFLGEGVSFKAKLIGILEVSEARGDRMCQEALADLKMAIRAAGEHKQRITINIAIDGLRLRDEKTGDSLYHHPVHKISFIAQDMSDSRAFGYIFGSPDTGHRFFGIKTDKAASQVVFELKKKEIELAKQHIEQKNRFGSSNTSSSAAAAAAAATASLFSSSSISSTKSYQNGDSQQQQHTSAKLSSVSETSTSKSLPSASESGGARGASGPSESAIADLVDLELELNSIQQGIHQMERITPSDPFGPSKDDPFSSDPFGDSFTSFPQKLFLPPPPSSRERQSRTASDTSSSLYSPRTPKTGGSIETGSQETHLFRTSHDDEPASCDWFTPTGGADSLFEDGPALSTEAGCSGRAAKDADTGVGTGGSLKESNASILSQFDVFTELDPLGTGRKTQPPEASLFTANFETNTHTTPSTTTTITTNNTINNTNTSFTNTNNLGNNAFQTDPFADDDPFDRTDPFADDDEFAKAVADPFDTDFVGEFKLFNKPDLSKPVNIKPSEPIEIESTKFKFPSLHHGNDKLQPLFPSPLSKSPNRSGMFDKQMSPRTTASSSSSASATLSKQNMFEVKFDSDKQRPYGKLTQLHENPSLDMSSESECAPEPPPRPATNITPIKPPPLPPKKQAGDLAVKPPPRPPHSEESHYDYMESYETGLNSLDGLESLEPTPPLPVPARKSRFDSADFGFAPQRPKKQFHAQSSDEDYLTPIVPPPLLPPQKKINISKDSGPTILLPPPMKKDSRRSDRFANQNQVTVASFLESKPKLTSTIATDKLNLTPDTLDITLSQLTLSGLNELANKLNIPASQLSNMTLVQLTSYLSNYVQSNNTTVSSESSSADATFPTFQADFSANFNDMNNTASKAEPYDRYAVFRELLQQEETSKPNEIAPLESKEVSPKSEEEEEEEDEEVQITELEETQEHKDNNEFKSTFDQSATDRYAALREIILEASAVSEEKETNLEPIEDLDEENAEEEIDDGQNNLNQESLNVKEDAELNDKLNREVESNIIEYESSLEPSKDRLTSSTPTKSPTRIKSPVPIAITEIIQTSNHLTSGSVSDVVSGSSPEIDNAGSNSEAVTKKNEENSTRESWAIFDTPNHRPESKEKQVQSEEGVSPWSSDSKEFGNGSPSDWQQRRDSGSEGDWTRRRRDRDASWWDTQGEVGGHYEKPSRSGYARERRSTDSYDDEWYEPDRPRRRRQQQPATHAWNKSAAGAGGQSSSSRDVSPWEEEEPRGTRREECWPSCRRSRGPSWDRHRRREDSWDEEDDYDYEDEYVGKFHWPERHGSRESERATRDSDRHNAPREPPDHWDTGGDQWTEERRHVRRRAHPQDDRWCRPDWDHDSDIVCGSKEKMRYGGSRWQNQDGKWRGDRERKRDSDRYYKRDHSQESPWEDDYSNDPDEPHSPRYLSARRNWKRPSSASEMDRKSGEIKPRQPHYMGTGGSDGERDRKYRTNRRSKSRDSQFADMPPHQRHKPDTSLTLGRYAHRTRDKVYGQKFDSDYSAQDKLEVKLDPSNKKSATLGRKKAKELTSPKVENETKIVRKTHLMFENDFVNSETDSPVATKTKFNFENELETSEAESPVSRYSRSPRGQSDSSDHFQSKRNLRTKQSSIGFENDSFSKGHHGKSSRIAERESGSKSVSPSMQMSMRQKSLFEDDFSPTEKSATAAASVEDSGITVIAEETVTEPRVSFTENNLDKATPSETRKSSKHILAKTRIANNIRGDANIKKSESVNIFARENDPFDDDFFSGRDSVEIQTVENSKVSPINVVTEFKWTEDFETFDIPEENDN